MNAHPPPSQRSTGVHSAAIEPAPRGSALLRAAGIAALSLAVTDCAHLSLAPDAQARPDADSPLQLALRTRASSGSCVGGTWVCETISNGLRARCECLSRVEANWVLQGLSGR